MILQRVERMKGLLARQLRPELRHSKGLSLTNSVVVALILLGTLATILETEASIRALANDFFNYLELFLFAFFLIEYIARIYSADYPLPNGERQSRLRYATSFWSLLDLVVLLSFVITFTGAALFYLRLARLLRIVRIARLGRFSEAIDLVIEAVSARKMEIMFTMFIAFVFMIIGAAMLYLVEAPHQPEAFGSIPRALWWSVATLTTVGYGDIIPVTAFGKVAAGFTAIFGVGLVAMPAGILAAAFSEAIQKRNQKKADEAAAEKLG